MNYLAGILNDAIQVMVATSFYKEKPDCDFSKTGGISSEEEEIRLINQRILEARKRKEARLEAARLKEIEHLAEREPTRKERKQLRS